MSGFSNIGELVDSELKGQSSNYTWRKTPSQVTTAGLWFDLSMSPGNPRPKYWFDAPPLVAKQISQSEDGGIFHGANKTPAKKFLNTFTGMTSTATALPVPIILCDYLLYYPSCDDSVTDPQIMDNSVTLPRYTDGDGVQVIAVSVAGRTGGQSFSFSYTNQDGTSGRTSQTVFQNSASSLGTLQSGGSSSTVSVYPFIGLQGSDRGVRSIQSVTMNGADVGLFTLILVKPLAQHTIKEITAPYEKNYFLESSIIPEIKDDAYVSMLCQPNGSLAATALIGDMKIVWN